MRHPSFSNFLILRHPRMSSTQPPAYVPVAISAQASPGGVTPLSNDLFVNRAKTGALIWQRLPGTNVEALVRQKSSLCCGTAFIPSVPMNPPRGSASGKPTVGRECCDISASGLNFCRDTLHRTCCPENAIEPKGHVQSLEEGIRVHRGSGNSIAVAQHAVQVL